MSIKLNKLGGTDWVEEGLKPTTDLVPTFEAVLDFAAVGIAQNAYQTLQANNVFENKDFLAADEMTDSTGTNNTVNTGSTTALFDTNKYILSSIRNGSSSTATPDSASGSYGSNTNAQGYAFTPSSDCVITSVNKMSGEASTTCQIGTGVSGSAVTGLIEQATFSGNTATFTGDIRLKSGTKYYVVATNLGSSRATYWDISVPYPVTNSHISISGSVRGSTSEDTTNGFSISSITTEVAAYQSSKNVLCDTNIKTLVGTEETILVYADKTTPTNTTMTVDISDGTTTLSAQPINETISINTLTAAADLELTFNLGTTNTSVTPELKGYGVLIK